MVKAIKNKVAQRDKLLHSIIRPNNTTDGGTNISYYFSFSFEQQNPQNFVGVEREGVENV